MSFRQFPATDATGESYVIIRDGRQFRTRGGELTLTT